MHLGLERVCALFILLGMHDSHTHISLRKVYAEKGDVKQNILSIYLGIQYILYLQKNKIHVLKV